MSAPHFVRFCRALALLSGAPLIAGVACSSTGDTSQTSDAGDAAGDTLSQYDGHPVGTLPCDGGCGVSDDAPTFEGGVSAYDGGDSQSDGDDAAYDGHPIGVEPYDAGPDVPGGGGGPQSLPDLPFLG